MKSLLLRALVNTLLMIGISLLWNHFVHQSIFYQDAQTYVCTAVLTGILLAALIKPANKKIV